MTDSTEPFTDLETLAISHHTLYEAYVTAGFTEDQAMQVVLQMVDMTFRSDD